MIYKGKTQTDIDADNKVAHIADIKAQLAALDSVVPRIVEDMIPFIKGFTPYKNKQDVLDKKVQLRGSLND